MSIISKLRCITFDVTGTLIAYKGELGDYYCMAAKSVGLPCPDYKRMHEGFKGAYTDMAKKYPCFGHAAKMPNIKWWKTCVRDSFIRFLGTVMQRATPKMIQHAKVRDYQTCREAQNRQHHIGCTEIIAIFHQFGGGHETTSEVCHVYHHCKILRTSGVTWLIKAGYDYDEETFEKVFRRIYSVFGSSAPYTIFPDSQPFMRWLREQGLTVGLVSNSEYRYQDVILPALGLNQGSEWDFGVFSGLEGVEKPNPRIYEIALEKAGDIAPHEVLHIGDSMRKDYIPARSVGMLALLLDRFKIPDAENWRKAGAPVFPDLAATQAWLTNEEVRGEKSVGKIV